jgi:hypothetical protein
MFMLSGTICVLLPWMMPVGTFVYVVWYGMTFMGIMMIWIGPMLLIGRMVGLHVHLFLPLPKVNEVISIHERRGGQAQFRRGRLDILEHIRLKDMIFKDTGGGTRIGGHRVIKTMETVNYNLHDWTAQYLHNIKEKYMVDSPDKLRRVHLALKNLSEPLSNNVNSIESQLAAIPEFKTVMTDPKYKTHKEDLLRMSLSDLRSMAELMYDGQVIHYEDYETFQDSVSPYDMESYTKKKEIHRMMQTMNYRDTMQQDWMKWVLVIFVLVIAAGIAYAFFSG